MDVSIAFSGQIHWMNEDKQHNGKHQEGRRLIKLVFALTDFFLVSIFFNFHVFTLLSEEKFMDMENELNEINLDIIKGQKEMRKHDYFKIQARFLSCWKRESIN